MLEAEIKVCNKLKEECKKLTQQLQDSSEKARYFFILCVPLLSIVNMHVSNCGKICSVGRAVNGRTGRAEGRRPDQYSGS